MKQYIEQLVELSKIDKEIDAFEPKIAEIRAELERVLRDKTIVEEAINKLNEEIQECELKKRKNELHLKELSDKLDELAKKSANVKTEKEAKALQLEEEIAKEQINFANEEIARLENVCETKLEEKESLETKFEEIEEKLSKTKEAVEAKLLAVEEDRKRVFEKKQELISKIPQKILAFMKKLEDGQETQR